MHGREGRCVERENGDARRWRDRWKEVMHGEGGEKR